MPSDQIILLADLHAHRWRQFSKLVNGVNDRLLDAINVIDDVGSYAKQHGIEHAIMAGDLFHKRAVLDVETFNAVFHALKRSPLKWYVMAGNHDQATKDGRIHSLEPLQALSNVWVVEGSPGKPAATEKIGNTVFHFFPYQDDANAAMDSLKRSLVKDKTAQRVAIMHHGFKGARVGSFLEYEVKEPLDADAARMLGYSWIFSGHYHERQMIVRGVFYIGSPMPHVRTDNSTKGFITLETHKVSGHSWIPIQQSTGMRRPPAFNTARASDMQNFLAVKRLPERVSGNFIDLIMDVDDDSLVDEVYKAGARWVEPKHEPKVVSKSSKRLDVDASMDPAKVVDRYVDHTVAEKQTELAPDLLKRVGKELIQEASRR